MPCLLVLLTLAFPRVVLIVLFLFTNYLQRAYTNLLWLLLGFVFLPVTTIAYAWFGRRTSSVNIPRPVRKRRSSLRLIALPTCRVANPRSSLVSRSRPARCCGSRKYP